MDKKVLMQTRFCLHKHFLIRFDIGLTPEASCPRCFSGARRWIVSTVTKFRLLFMGWLFQSVPFGTTPHNIVTTVTMTGSDERKISCYMHKNTV